MLQCTDVSECRRRDEDTAFFVLSTILKDLLLVPSIPLLNTYPSLAVMQQIYWLDVVVPIDCLIYWCIHYIQFLLEFFPGRTIECNFSLSFCTANLKLLSFLKPLEPRIHNGAPGIMVNFLRTPKPHNHFVS